MIRPLGFIGNRLVRDSEKREAGTIAAALNDARLRLFLQADRNWLVRGPAEAPTAEFDRAQAQALGAELADAVLLGWHPADGSPVAAAKVPSPNEDDTALRTVDLRSLAMAGMLDADIEGRLGQAQHLLYWNARTRHCGVCGGTTIAEAGGYRRRCTACGELFFPRTDPVVIMLVHDGRDRCLLGRQRQFAPGMYSALAGFVEPGETLEDAVRREVQEEAGIDVGTVRYHASQPWPFPGSLMIGCLGRATSTDIRFDCDELEDCRWFERAEVQAMLAGRHPEGLGAPKPFAIAHTLIQAFMDEGSG